MIYYFITKEIKMAKKEFIEDESLNELANKVIEEKNLDYLNGVRIKYLLVTPNISKTVVGRCIKSSSELKYFSETDYIIEFSNDIWEKVDEKTKELVMYHELLHILIVNKEDGETSFQLAKHDVQDFSQILKHYGIDWFKNFSTQVASIHDMTPTEQDNISI